MSDEQKMGMTKSNGENKSYNDQKNDSVKIVS